MDELSASAPAREEIPIDEMRDLQLLNTEFEDKDLMEKLRTIEGLGREIEVGGQTSYQNREFVLNPVEFPEGTTGKSRQAIFEASVRVDSLKGLVFDYFKTKGELKIVKAKLMRAEAKMIAKESDAADKLEAEGEADIARAEIRQKELSVEAMKGRTKHLLRSIDDFYGEFEKNEKLCEGFSVLEWNTPEQEHKYWQTVTDRKVMKHVAYQQAALPKETGDSLPLQNKLSIPRIQEAAQLVSREMEDGNMRQQIAMQHKRGQIDQKTTWKVSIGSEETTPEHCPHRQEHACVAREAVKGSCSYRYCFSLGFAE